MPMALAARLAPEVDPSLYRLVEVAQRHRTMTDGTLCPSKPRVSSRKSSSIAQLNNRTEPQSFSISSKPTASSSTSQPLPIATKLQKKNQAQAAAKKAQKEAEEADRLRRLAEHRRGLERYAAVQNHWQC